MSYDSTLAHKIQDIDIALFLRVGGMVFEEGADGDVERRVTTFQLVGELQKEDVVVHIRIGARKNGNLPTLQRLKLVDGEVRRVDVGEPEQMGAELAQDDCRTCTLYDADRLIVDHRNLMQAEEAVLNPQIGSANRIAGFQDLRKPSIAEAAIKTAGELIYQPIDGLARFAFAK